MDLWMCDEVLRSLCKTYDLEQDKDAKTRLGPIIIELYRQGVRNRVQLLLLAGSTRAGGL
jgi:hypothetical protein